MRINFIDLAKRHQVAFSRLILGILVSVGFLIPFSIDVQAGSLTNMKDTLSTSRPSVSTSVNSAITAGDTTITVVNTNGFAQGDTITLCNATCSTTETKIIASIISVTQLGLTAGATNSYATSGFVYLNTGAIHTIVITTRSAVSNGKFIVYIPATNTTTPQSTGFALNQISTTTNITLAGATAGTISTSTSGSNIAITIPFTGSLAASSNATITIGSTIKMLNPTKTATQGTADTWSVEVDETDNTSNVIDTTTAKIGTIESVTVSATVAPSLNFTINAVATSTTVTAHPTSVGTTATSVPFGVLTINASTTAAQFIHVDTNSNSGYVVTVQQDGSLRKSNGTTIVDFNSATAADNDGTVGFGYSLQSKAGSPTMTFNYNDSSRKFNSLGFSSSSPVTVMSNSGPANGDEGYVDYYVKVNATQAQGVYQNLVTYIATAIY